MARRGRAGAGSKAGRKWREIIFEHACKLGLEGIVSKRVDGKYRAGPSKRWIKVKNTKHPAILRVKEAYERERRRG